MNYQNGASSISIYNNTTDYHKWGIAIGSTSSSCSASGINVYGNSIGPHFDAMLDSAQTCFMGTESSSYPRHPEYVLQQFL